MATYHYKARDPQTKLVQGVMNSDSPDTVAARLKQMGYIPITIYSARKEINLAHLFDRFHRVSYSDLNLFTRQLYTLQRAGLPLLSSLSALKDQTVNPTLKQIVEQMTKEIEGGASLSAAMERYPHIFNSLYINMVKTGEMGGRLPEILERLMILGEHDEKIRMRIKTATRYPVIVVVAIMIAFTILITFVVPRFAELYSKFNTPLPLPTRMLIGINYAVVNFWWLILGAIGLLYFMIGKIIQTNQGTWVWDGLKLKIPVFGPLLLKLAMSRFGRTTGMLMRSGVPILQILELVEGSVGNAVIAKTIHNIQLSVNEGKGMLEPMKASGLFPPVVTQMVATGEETGKIDELLVHVSDYYDSEIDYTLNNLIALIEPILILILGISVLFMALGIFLPLWNMIRLF